jgi:hypothetical protein
MVSSKQKPLDDESPWRSVENIRRLDLEKDPEELVNSEEVYN